MDKVFKIVMPPNVIKTFRDKTDLWIEVSTRMIRLLLLFMTCEEIKNFMPASNQIN